MSGGRGGGAGAPVPPTLIIIFNKHPEKGPVSNEIETVDLINASFLSAGIAFFCFVSQIVDLLFLYFLFRCFVIECWLGLQKVFVGI